MTETPTQKLLRLVRIMERVSNWKLKPAVTVYRICELTGLSDTQVRRLIADGIFLCPDKVSNEVLLESVLQYYASRVSRLSKEGKLQCKPSSI